MVRKGYKRNSCQVPFQKGTRQSCTLYEKVLESSFLKRSEIGTWQKFLSHMKYLFIKRVQDSLVPFSDLFKKVLEDSFLKRSEKGTREISRLVPFQKWILKSLFRTFSKRYLRINFWKGTRHEIFFVSFSDHFKNEDK